jgi:hypothetical protein
MSIREGKCDRCASAIGEDAKVQPTTVLRPNDGVLEGTYCAYCMVWWRANQSAGDGWGGGTANTSGHNHAQFNPTQMCVARCQFCHWVAVSNGARPGEQLRCGHCGKPGAIAVQPPAEYLETMRELLEHERNEMAKRSGSSENPKLPGGPTKSFGGIDAQKSKDEKTPNPSTAPPST